MKETRKIEAEEYVFDEYEIGDAAPSAAKAKNDGDEKPQPENRDTENRDTEVRNNDMREGERRQNTQRRGGLRGEWEERRLFDRRDREYSIFGKRIGGEVEDIAPLDEIEDNQVPRNETANGAMKSAKNVEHTAPHASPSASPDAAKNSESPVDKTEAALKTSESKTTTRKTTTPKPENATNDV